MHRRQPNVVTRAARLAVEHLEQRHLLSSSFPFPSGESDFGDAPDSYGTLLGSNGPVHEVTFDRIRLGGQIDIEPNGLPTTSALGDDADNLDDEDGVSIPQAFAPAATITVNLAVVNEPGLAMGWIDFNRDGKFGGGVEQIIDGPVSQGINSFSIAVPANAVEGFTYARFRVSNDMIPGPNGIGTVGEVEDYRVRIDSGAGGGNNGDFGDAPDSYGTTLAKDGARHAFLPKLVLGEVWDEEPDGQPGVDADGDDKTGSVDDEDGVQFDGNFRQDRVDTVLVTAGDEGFLSVWLDLQGDGTFDPQDLVFQDRIGGGDNEIEIDVPAGASAGETYMRFRFSDEIVVSPVGAGGFGEVEDYLVDIDAFVPPVQEFDFGDAPNFPGAILDYPTLLSSDGARHSVTASFSLGSVAGDLEPDGQQSVNALGDDNDPGLPDDEDGVVERTYAPGMTNAVNVNVRNPFADARLDAWYDWNRDGDWDDAGEHAIDSYAVPLNLLLRTLTIPVDVPANALPGDAYSRYRLSVGNAVDSPRGFGGLGEVEDYMITIGRTSANAANSVVVRPSSYLPQAARIEGLSGTTNQVISYHRNSGLAVDIDVIGGQDYRLWSGGATFGIVPDLGGDAADLLQIQSLPGTIQRVQLPAETLRVPVPFGDVELDATNLIVGQGSYGNMPVITSAGTSSLTTQVTLLTDVAPASGQVVRVAGLTIGAGREVTLDGPADTAWEFPGQTNQSDTGLTVRSGGQLDVQDQVVLLSGASQGLDYATDRVASAFDGGTWDGTGITSSLAGGNVGLGYGTADDVVLDDALGLMGLDPAADVLLGLTVAGDANLSRSVNLADFGRLRGNFGSGNLWAQGDFNYDGNVNLADFGLLRANFGQTYTPSYAGALFDDEAVS
jgi:hypothetical protein